MRMMRINIQDDNDERLKQNEGVRMPLTQLSGVASTILSCRKMGMCSPIELNKPTIVAIVLLVSFQNLQRQTFQLVFFLLFVEKRSLPGQGDVFHV